jgi:hypothetical protein
VAKGGPERELIRRALPFVLPAIALAFLSGAALAGVDAGMSAAIGATIVFANFAAHGLSLEWAAGISLTVLFAVGLAGFLVRLAVIVAILAALHQLAWFSVPAFAAAVVPGTLGLLAFEAKHLSGRMQVDLWDFHREGA